MTYKGHVKSGVIVLDDACTLPEGMSVEVIPRLPEQAQIPEQDTPHTSFYESIKEFIGCIDDLPEDFAANHDHYIHGVPRRE